VIIGVVLLRLGRSHLTSRRRLAVLLFRGGLLLMLLLVSVVLPQGQDHGPAQLPRRIGKEPLQALLNGETHQVLPGQDSQDLEKVRVIYSPFIQPALIRFIATLSRRRRPEHSYGYSNDVIC